MYDDKDVISNGEEEELELEALRLIDRADDLIDKGGYSNEILDEALDLYEKAAQIYLDLGSYIKLDELYIEIVNIISKYKNNIQAVYRLKSIIRKTEELELEEISAKLLIQLGNVSNRMNDWETAGESYEKASNYLYQADPDEFYNLASILLLKAGQAYEKSHEGQEYGKSLILKGVMKINKFYDLMQTEEQRALHLLETQNIIGAAMKFKDMSAYFKEALEHLDEIIEEEEEDSPETHLSAKSRLIHLLAEYLTLSALCLRATTKREYNEEIKEMGNEAVELYIDTIKLQKESLLMKKTDYHQEELFRLTFDGVLLAVIQGLLGRDQVKVTQLLTEQTENGKDLDKKIIDTPYYKIAERIEKVGIWESFDVLLDMQLGHLEKIKNTIINFFKS